MTDTDVERGGTRLPRALTPFRHPAYRRLAVALVLATFAGGVWVVGLTGAARMVPFVLLSWAVGSLGDHVRRDRLVRTTLGLRLACLSGAGLALADDRVGWAVLATTLAVAVGTPTFPAIAASLPDDRRRFSIGHCAWIPSEMDGYFGFHDSSFLARAFDTRMEMPPNSALP